MLQYILKTEVVSSKIRDQSKQIQENKFIQAYLKNMKDSIILHMVIHVDSTVPVKGKHFWPVETTALHSQIL